MINYYLGKLAAANYQIAIHPGAANERLTSQVDRILILSSEIIPEEYRRDFSVLIKRINESYGSRPPHKIYGMRNKTAARYIKLLLDIQEGLEAQVADD